MYGIVDYLCLIEWSVYSTQSGTSKVIPSISGSETSEEVWNYGQFLHLISEGAPASELGGGRQLQTHHSRFRLCDSIRNFRVSAAILAFVEKSNEIRIFSHLCTVLPINFIQYCVSPMLLSET
jgi:hypothetical protein